MLKWKRVSLVAQAGIEELNDLLAGMSGKNRVIKYLGTDNRVDLVRLRVYRDANQIVDFDSDFLTDSAPFVPMDLPLAEGQLCNVGFYNGSGTQKTLAIVIGYEETD